MRLSKRQFKICEAVHLGLDYYYMSPKDRRRLELADIEEAEELLPKLPDGWWRKKEPWNTTK